MCASRWDGTRCARGRLGRSCCRTGPGLSPAVVPAAQGLSLPCRLPPGRSEGPRGVLLPCFCPGISLVPQLRRVTACPCPRLSPLPVSLGAGEAQGNPEAG